MFRVEFKFFLNFLFLRMEKLVVRFYQSTDGEVEVHDFLVGFPLNKWIREWISNPDEAGPMKLTKNPKLGFRTSIRDIQVICKQKNWHSTLKMLKEEGYTEVSVFFFFRVIFIAK